MNNVYYWCCLSSKGIPTWNFEPLVDLKLDIPRASGCRQLTLVWPKLMDYDGENCFCLPHQTTVYSFADCARSCGTDYSIEILGDSVVFNSPGPATLLVHFICDEHPCSPESPCALESILESHQLVIGMTNQISCNSDDNSAIYFIMAGCFSVVLIFIIIVIVSSLSLHCYLKKRQSLY